MDIAKELKNSPDNKPVKIVIVLPTSAYFMSGIRDFTLSLTQNMTGFSEQWAYRFQSVVDELCNNAIEHGSCKGAEIKISFISDQDKSLEVIVEDTGTGKDKISADGIRKIIEEKKNLPITKLGIRGRGLAKIVSEWSDELDFTDRPGGGLKIRIKKYLKKEESSKMEDDAFSREAGHVDLKTELPSK